MLLNSLGAGAGGNDYTTYQASASYLASDATGLVLTNSEFALLDLASKGCRDAGVLSGGRFGATGRGATPAPGKPAAATVTVHAQTMSGRLLAAVPTDTPAASAAADVASAAAGGCAGAVEARTFRRPTSTK